MRPSVFAAMALLTTQVLTGGAPASAAATTYIVSGHVFDTDGNAVENIGVYLWSTECQPTEDGLCFYPPAGSSYSDETGYYEIEAEAGWYDGSALDPYRGQYKAQGFEDPLGLDAGAPESKLHVNRDVTVDWTVIDAELAVVHLDSVRASCSPTPKAIDCEFAGSTQSAAAKSTHGDLRTSIALNGRSIYNDSTRVPKGGAGVVGLSARPAGLECFADDGLSGSTDQVVFEARISPESGSFSHSTLTKTVDSTFCRKVRITRMRDRTVKAGRPVNITPTITSVTEASAKQPLGVVRVYDGKKLLGSYNDEKCYLCYVKVPRLGIGRHKIKVVFLPFADSPFDTKSVTRTWTVKRS